MKTFLIRLIQTLAAIALLIGNQLASAEISHSNNICKAGIADGVWPVWVALFAILALSMYAKITLAED